MNNSFLLGILVLNCFVCAYSQVLLKQAARTVYSSFWGQYLNLKVLLAYCLFFAVLLVNSLLMKILPLMIISPVSESLPLVFTMFLSFILLSEKLTKKKIIGSLVIIIGIIIISV